MTNRNLLDRIYAPTSWRKLNLMFFTSIALLILGTFIIVALDSNWGLVLALPVAGYGGGWFGYSLRPVKIELPQNDEY
jgi:hypothetical protein